MNAPSGLELRLGCWQAEGTWETQSRCFFLQVVMEVEEDQEEVWRVHAVEDHETPGE